MKKNHHFIVETDSLSEAQVLKVRQLAEICCRHDHIRLSYPVENDPALVSSDDTCIAKSRHWLCYGIDGMLCCALAVLPCQDSLAECIAFTHPDHRRQGLFLRLLEQALSYYEDCDILFVVSNHCPDTKAALLSLEAELESQEYQMEIDLTDGPDRTLTKPGSHLQTCSLQKVCSQDNANSTDPTETFWQLTAPDVSSAADSGDPMILYGTCRTSRLSGSCACLHHVEILPGLRRKGYGYALLSLLLPALLQEGISRVTLQVSGSNEAALALYKKTGFRITETLSYYLY